MHRFEGIAGSESATRPSGHLYCLNTPFLCATILQTVSFFFFSGEHTRRRRLQGGVHRAGMACRPEAPAAQGEGKIPEISKKEWMRASWKPRRAKQMWCPSKRAEDLRFRFTIQGRFREVVPAEFGCVALAR
jgi:hypothetical protein